MALSLAQAQKQVSGTSLAYTSNVVSGNLLVCIGFTSSGTITGITDSVGSTWALVTPTSSHGADTEQIWWAVAGGSGANTLTVAGASFLEGYIYEVQGFVGTPTLDQKNSATGFSGNPTVGPLNTLYAPEFLVAFSFYSGAASSGGVGWTATVTPNANLVEYIFEAATGSFTATANPTDTGWAMVFATFGVAKAPATAQVGGPNAVFFNMQ